MPKKISVDEIIARRKDLGSDVAPVVKAARAPSSWNKDARSARFVMNAQAPDRMGDVIVTDGIDLSQFEKNPVALLFHSSRSWPIGTWGDVEKLTKGRPPRLEGTMTLLPPDGPVKEVDEAAWMIENGGVRGCSIGFIPNWDEVEMILDDEGKWQGGLEFKACEMVEASLVPIPASPQSLIRSAGGEMRVAKEFIEEVLDTYTKTPEGLLLPREEYERAYKVTVEKISEDTIAPAPLAAGTVVTQDLAHTSDADVATDADDAELVAFKVFLSANLQDGDSLFANYKLVDGETIQNGVSVQHQDAGDPSKYEFPGAMSVEHEAAIDARVLEIHATKAASVPENKTGTDTPLVVTLDADVTAIEAKVEHVSGLFTRLFEKFPMFFPKAVAERIEPTITPPDPPAPPTIEAISEAKAKAQAVRDRLVSKGLIAA